MPSKASKGRWSCSGQSSEQVAHTRSLSDGRPSSSYLAGSSLEQSPTATQEARVTQESGGRGGTGLCDRSNPVTPQGVRRLVQLYRCRCMYLSRVSHQNKSQSPWMPCSSSCAKLRGTASHRASAASPMAGAVPTEGPNSARTPVLEFRHLCAAPGLASARRHLLV